MSTDVPRAKQIRYLVKERGDMAEGDEAVDIAVSADIVGRGCRLAVTYERSALAVLV